LSEPTIRGFFYFPGGETMAIVKMKAPNIGTFDYNTDAGIKLPDGAVQVSNGQPSSTAKSMANAYAGTTSSQNSPSYDYRSTLDSVRSKLTQPVQPFTYNPDADTAYQAAANAARRNAQTAQANTNARLRATGQGHSSYSEAVANQIAQQAEQNIANDIQPQYENMAYNRYLNDQNMQRQNLMDQLTVGQDYNALDQQAFQNALAKAQDSRADASLTGYYLPPVAQNYINQILDLKRQATQQGVTSDQMNTLKSEADDLRQKLAATGVDPNIVGYDADYNQALKNVADYRGVPTIQKQQLDISNKNQALNETQVMAQLTGKLPDGTPTNAAQQQQLQNLWTVAEQTGTIPDTLADLYGIPRGTQTQAAKQQAIQNSIQQGQLAVSQQNANTSAMNAKNSLSNAAFGQLMDVWKATGVAPDGLQAYGIQPGTSLADAKSDTEIKKELDGLDTGLRAGQIDPAQALDEISQKEKIGIYSSSEASQLRSLVQSYATTHQSPMPQLSPAQASKIEQSGGKNYQAMNQKQLEKEWENDPSGQKSNVGLYDWINWVQDPRGRMAGVSFQAYQQAYGPRLMQG
jgi:hypothetical protein